MPLPINVTALVHGKAVESERIEFKAGWNAEEVARTLCAFANDFQNWGGGYLVLGVESQNGRPVFPPKGLRPEQADAWQRKLLELGHTLRPTYHPISEILEIEGRLVLIVWIPAGEMRPYEVPVSFAKGERRTAAYIRLHSNTVEAKAGLKSELYQLANRIPFDDRQNPDAPIDALQPTLIQSYLAEIKSDLAPEALRQPLEDLGRRMQIVRGPSEAPRPLNVGLLFFTPDPSRWFPQTQIDIVHLPQGRSGDQIIERSFKGPLSIMLRDALNYLRNNVVVHYTRKVPDRAEAEAYANVPYPAIEEALVNAVYHRSYEEREPIEVQITPEEITLLSFPGPDATLSMEALRKGRAVARRYRNRRIGEFLKELDLTEGRGTGIPKIIKSMRANGSPAPRFETDEGRRSFLVTLPALPKPAAPVTPPVTPPNEPPFGAAMLRTILDACLEPKRPSELRTLLSINDRRHLRRIYLNPLVELGWAERTVPHSPNSPQQRYVTTAAGKAWLANHAHSENPTPLE